MGYQFLKVTDVHPAGVVPIAQARPSMVKYLRAAKAAPGHGRLFPQDAGRQRRRFPSEARRSQPGPPGSCPTPRAADKRRHPTKGAPPNGASPPPGNSAPPADQATPPSGASAPAPDQAAPPPDSSAPAPAPPVESGSVGLLRRKSFRTGPSHRLGIIPWFLLASSSRGLLLSRFMRRLVILPIVLAMLCPALAEDWSVNGKLYKNVVVVDRDDDGVRH